MTGPEETIYCDAWGRRIDPPRRLRKKFRKSAGCLCRRGQRTAHPNCPVHSELARTTAPWRGLPTLPPEQDLSCLPMQVAIDNCKSDKNRRNFTP